MSHPGGLTTPFERWRALHAAYPAARAVAQATDAIPPASRAADPSLAAVSPPGQPGTVPAEPSAVPPNAGPMAAAPAAMGAGGLIRVVLVDVDGVLTPGEGHAADLEVLARCAAINAAATVDPRHPAIALCTGRPAPYVEAMAQLIGAFLPCSFEQGCGLFDPVSFRYHFHPALGPDYWERLAALRHALTESVLRPGRAFVQPGKEASMTLYPLGDTDLDWLAEAAAEAVARLGPPRDPASPHGPPTDRPGRSVGALAESDGAWFDVVRNVAGIELRPRGIDKGVGAAWIAELADVPLEAFAGVGDSDPDLAFLRRVGYAAAPANATLAVREAAHDVASLSNGRGLLEILDRLLARNGAAPGAAPPA